jgi:hypothetical protein
MKIDDIIINMSMKKQLSLIDKISDPQIVQEIARKIADVAKYRITGGDGGEIKLVIDDVYFNKDEFVKKYGLQEHKQIIAINREIFSKYLTDGSVEEAIKFGMDNLKEEDSIKYARDVLSEIATTDYIDANGCLGWITWSSNLSRYGDKVLKIATEVLKDKDLANQYLKKILDYGLSFPEISLEIFDKSELENMVMDSLVKGQSPVSSKYFKEIIDVDKNKKTIMDIIKKKIDTEQYAKSRYVGTQYAGGWRDENVYDWRTNKSDTAELIFDIYKDLELKNYPEFESVMYNHIKKSLDMFGKLPQNGFTHYSTSTEANPKNLKPIEVNNLISEEHSREILKQLYKININAHKDKRDSLTDIRIAMKDYDVISVLSEEIECAYLPQIDDVLEQREYLVDWDKKNPSNLAEFDNKAKDISLSLCNNIIDRATCSNSYYGVINFIKRHYKDYTRDFERKVLMSKIEKNFYDITDIKKAETFYDKEFIKDLKFKLFKREDGEYRTAMDIEERIKEYLIEGHDDEIAEMVLTVTKGDYFSKYHANLQLNKEYKTAITLLEKSGNKKILQNYIETVASYDMLRDEPNTYLYEMAKKYDVKGCVSIMEELGYNKR